MTGPNEPQDSHGHTPSESPDPWARPTGSAPGSPWAPPGSAAPAQPTTDPQAPTTAWPGQQNPGQQNPGQQNLWGQPAAPQPAWGGQPTAPAWGQQPQPAAAPGWGAPPQGGQQQWPGAPAPGWAGQQPGGPQQPWGAPQGAWQPPGTPTSGGKSKLPWILAAAAVVLVLVVGGITAATRLGGKVLDRSATQAGVSKVLTDSYGATQVGDVQCPSGQRVEVGHSFSCQVTVDGQFREVTVTVTDDNGTYEVSRPR